MNKYTIVSVVLLGIFSSCKKKEKAESIVVKIPSISLIDNPIYSSAAITTPGAVYTDPGVRIKDEMGVESVVTTPTESDVNLKEPGFYSVKYKIKTKYGYELVTSRLVLITSVDPSEDLSGVYARSSNGQEVNITKVATGLYKTDNVGGVPDAPEYIYDIYFGFPNDTTLVVPSQYNPLGDNEMYCDNAAIVRSGEDVTIQWIVRGTGYGTALRKFIKQK